MPPKSPPSEHPELFRSALVNLVDRRHSLVRLAGQIDWERFATTFGPLDRDGVGRPGLPTRLMVGLHLLKHMDGLSDDAVCARSRLDQAALLASDAARAGLAARLAAREASAWLGSQGCWVHPRDLVLHEAGLVASIAAAVSGGRARDTLPATLAGRRETEVQDLTVEDVADGVLITSAMSLLRTLQRLPGARDPLGMVLAGVCLPEAGARPPSPVAGPRPGLSQSDRRIAGAARPSGRGLAGQQAHAGRSRADLDRAASDPARPLAVRCRGVDLVSGAQ